MADTPPEDVPDFVTEGSFVSWTTWCGTATVQVTAVEPTRIFYTAWDGVWGFWEATRWNTLPEDLAHLRPATEHEITQWQQHHARFHNH